MDTPVKHFGIYNSVSKRYVYGIMETSKSKAMRALFNEIGKDAYKWRYEVRKVNDEIFDRQRRKRR